MKKTGNPPAAAETAAALRTLIASRYEGNFGNLNRALGGDRSLNARLWRAVAKKKPSMLDAELAKNILALIPRAKGDGEKKAIAVIRAAAQAMPTEGKMPPKARRVRSVRRKKKIVTGDIPGIDVQVSSGGKLIGSFTSAYEGRDFSGDVRVTMDDTDVVVSVRIPKTQALGLFLG